MCEANINDDLRFLTDWNIEVRGPKSEVRRQKTESRKVGKNVFDD